MNEIIWWKEYTFELTEEEGTSFSEYLLFNITTMVMMQNEAEVIDIKICCSELNALYK